MKCKTATILKLAGFPQRPKRASPEDALQRSVARYLDLVCKQGGFWWTAITNNPRNAIDGARLNRMGVRRGIADILIIGNVGKAYFLELKSTDGRQSEAQKAFESTMKKLGCGYAVCRDLDEVEMRVKIWGLLRS
jgi:hypothetical protein